MEAIREQNVWWIFLSFSPCFERKEKKKDCQQQSARSARDSITTDDRRQRITTTLFKQNHWRFSRSVSSTLFLSPREGLISPLLSCQLTLLLLSYPPSFHRDRCSKLLLFADVMTTNTASIRYHQSSQNSTRLDSTRLDFSFSFSFFYRLLLRMCTGRLLFVSKNFLTSRSHEKVARWSSSRRRRRRRRCR